MRNSKRGRGIGELNISFSECPHITISIENDPLYVYAQRVGTFGNSANSILMALLSLMEHTYIVAISHFTM